MHFAFLSPRPLLLPIHRTHTQVSAHPTATLQSKPPPVTTPTPPPQLPKPTSPPLQALPNSILLPLVPFLWSTYTIVTKHLLTLPHPPPEPLLNLLSFIFAALTLLPLRPPLPLSTLRVGGELGTYLFLGALTNLHALNLTSASRVAFLVQLTTVLVPVADFLLGTPVPKRTLPAAMLALAGAAVLAWTGEGGALNLGDAFAVASAALYSVHVLRLQALAPTAPPVSLVHAKVLTQTILALIFLLFTSNSSFSYLHSLPTLPSTELLTLATSTFWLGFGTTTLATLAQVIGQQRVGASKAAVLYATQPVFAVALAYLTGLDSLTPQELIGGAMIVASGLMLSRT